MYIGGYVGWGYEQAATAMPSQDGIFHQCEWGSTVAGSRGNLCAWDLVDNTAVTGIMRETRGLRCKIHPILAPTTVNPSRPCGVLTHDVAAFSTAASARTTMVLLLAYGPADYLRADTTANGDMVAGGHIIPTGDTAGTFNGPEDNAALQDNERLNSVGFSYQIVAAAGGVTTFKGFVSCLAAK